MARVSDKYVLIVLPNEEGDETKMKSIVEKGNAEKRKKRVEEIKKTLADSGFVVKEKRIVLKFRFSNLKSALEVLSAVEFQNKVKDSDKTRIEDFLKKRKGAFTQGASFILGERK
jgi:transcription elongation factor